MNNVDISKDVFKDTDIDQFMTSNVILTQSKDVIKNIMNTPVSNKDILKERQKCLNMYDVSIQLQYLKQYEEDINWILDIHKNVDINIMNMIFPSDYYTSICNYSSYSLELYHFYRIYTIPFMHLSSPLSIVVLPYYILRKMNFNISISWYVNYLWSVVKLYVNSNGDIKYFMIRWVSFIIYILLYLYGIYETFDVSYILHNMRQDMIKKIEGVSSYVKMSKKILDNIPIQYWNPFLINNGYYEQEFEIELKEM